MVQYLDNQDAHTESTHVPRVWSVSEVNHAVRELLEQTLYPCWIRGEIGNLTIHRSGHVYFTLKDSRCQMSAVFFRGAETARQLHLKTGLEVEVWGRLTLYEPRGNYQVIVDRIRARGVGSLRQRFEELKARLRAEGLFDDERKRPIPVLPRCVGVVTSPEGAAIRDFLQILGRRFANLHIRICPTAVQGASAAAQVAGAIGLLNQQEACDVIVVTRGGGSLEDLWAFNEEVVARAIAASAIPVISAVGHERDFTICDYTADLRVPTPSAAAELVITGKAELIDRLRTCHKHMEGSLRLRLSECRRRLERAAGSPVFREPAGLVRMYQQRLDELSLRLAQGLSRRCERMRSQLERAESRLTAMNPRQVLGRGYAILLAAKTGTAVRTADDVTTGDRVRAILGRGELGLNVKEIVTEEEKTDA